MRIFLLIALIGVYGGMGSATGQVLGTPDPSRLPTVVAITLVAHTWYEHHLQNLYPAVTFRRSLQFGAWLTGFVSAFL